MMDKKRIAGIITAVVMGIVAFKNAYDDYEQEKEFEQLKSDVAELKAQKESE